RKDLAKPLKDGRGFTTDMDELILVPGKTSKGNLIKRSAVDVEDSIKSGYQPIRFLEPVMIDGKKVTHGLVPVDKANFTISNLPKQVLHKRIGYVARIRKPGYHYVKDTRTGKTLAYFAKLENGQAWAAKYMKDQAAKGVSADEAVNLQVFRDRDHSAMGALLEDAQTYGGLYTGARSSDALIVGDDLA